MMLYLFILTLLKVITFTTATFDPNAFT